MRTVSKKVRLALLLAATVGVLAVAAACGGGSGGKARQAPGGATGQSVAGQPADGATKSDLNAITGAVPEQGAAPPAASSGDGSDIGALPLPSQLDQKIIMVSTLSVAVQDVAGAFEQVGAIAAGAGGFVASSSFGRQDDGETATATVRVPSSAYQDTLTRLRKLGDVQSEDTNTNDVTEQYTDLQSRLRSLQAALQTYLQFLNRAGDIGQVLQVQDRINQTQAEIEQVQGRINMLDNRTELATITVSLNPPAVAKEPKTGGGGPLETARDAFQTSLAVLLGAATVALAVAAFSWWLVPLGAAGWYLGQRQLRASRTRQAPPPAPPAAP